MKLDRYTQKAQEAIVAAQRLATEAESPVLDAEHLLAALLQDPEGTPSSPCGASAPIPSESRSTSRRPCRGARRCAAAACRSTSARRG
jgi:hypothetical protein